MNKKLRACIALVLIFTLLLPSYAFAALKPDTTKAKVELVYMTNTGTADAPQYTIADSSTMTALKQNDIFYVGVKLVDFSNIAESNKRMSQFSGGIVYDSAYLNAEPAIQAEIESQKQQYEDAGLEFDDSAKKSIIADAWDARIKTTASNNVIKVSNVKFNASIPNLEKVLNGIEGSDYSETQKSIVFSVDDKNNALNQFNGVVAEGKVALVGVFEFQVKELPPASKIAGLLGCQTVRLNDANEWTVDFGAVPNHVHYAADATATGNEMKDVIDFDTTAVNSLKFEAAPEPAKPAITGTVTITGDAATLKYDGTTAVEADVTGVTITGDSSTTPTLTYQWYACDDATGTNATAITGATNASFTPTKAEVGKYLKVVVTGTTNCSGTLEAIATNAVGAAEVTLTATNLAFDNKTYDGTKAATMTTGTTPTVTALGSDTVTVKLVSAEFADANVGNGKTVTAKFALDGADAAAYKLTGADGDGNVTVNDKTANITAAKLTLGTVAAVSGKPNEAITLPADVTINGTVNNETLTKDTDYELAYSVEDANVGNAGDTGISTGAVTGTTVTPTGEGTASAKVTVTLKTTTLAGNYTFDGTANEATFDIKVKDKTATAIAIKTAPTNFGEVNVGDTIDLSGLVVTVTYDDGTTADVALADFAANGIDVKVDDEAVTSGTTPAKSDMDGKDVTVSVATASDPATAKVGTLTVKNLATVALTVTTAGVAADREYNGAADKSVTSWTTDPVYELKSDDPMAVDGWALDTTAAKYEYADGNAGENKVITVSGLKLTKTGETPIEVTATVDGGGNIATGKITPAAITVTAKSSLKTTATKKVSSFLDVTGLKAGDTAASVFDGTAAVNFGSENDKGFTLSVKDAEGNAVTTALASGLTKGSYAVTFAQTDATKCANYTVTGFTDSELTVKKSSGGGSSSSTPSTPTYTVTFKAGDHGTITGATSDSVEKGDSVSSTPKVTAKEGWSFIGWSTDGKTTVDPTDVEITKNTTFTALYEEGKVAPAADHFAYIEGVGGNKFNPEGNMSRAEAATMLARLHKDFADKAADNKFSDIAAGSWYYNYVTFAAENGIVTGYVDGTFGPNKTITRAEFAAMLARFIELDAADGETAFSDVPSDNWAAGYIDALVEKGVVNGYNDGTFRPEQTITRAEAVKMINGAIGHTPDKAKVEENLGNYDTNFSDVAKSHWAYYEIMESATDHFSGDFH